MARTVQHNVLRLEVPTRAMSSRGEGGAGGRGEGGEKSEIKGGRLPVKFVLHIETVLELRGIQVLYTQTNVNATTT